MMDQEPLIVTKNINHSQSLPSGKRLHNCGQSPCFKWENSLIPWPFLNSCVTVMTRWYIPYKIPLSHHFPMGFPICFPLNHHFPMVSLWFSHGLNPIFESLSPELRDPPDCRLQKQRKLEFPSAAAGKPSSWEFSEGRDRYPNRSIYADNTICIAISYHIISYHIYIYIYM